MELDDKHYVDSKINLTHQDMMLISSRNNNKSNIKLKGNTAFKTANNINSDK